MALTLTRRTLAVAACLLTSSLTLAPATAASADGETRLQAKFIANLVARHSGKCLEVYGAKTGDGDKVDQWTCNTGTYMDWQLIATSGGYYTIRAVHSGKCLEVYGAGTADGAKVDQWTCHANQPYMEWRLDQKPNGYFNIVNRHSGKCLEVYGAGTADGAKVDQWTCFNEPYMEWRLA
ncbi:RICIN domain-containing protein [Microbispora sp. NPDC004025]